MPNPSGHPKHKKKEPAEFNTPGYETTLFLPQEEGGSDMLEGASMFVVTELEKEYYHNLVNVAHEEEKYTIKNLLNTGGMGAILTVLEHDVHRAVAMKVLLPALKNDGNALSSFVTEAKITGFLEHPNILPIHELGFLNRIGMFFTMKLAQGETLQETLNHLKRGTPEYVEKYTPYVLLNIFRKVCDAVAFAHSKNIIHQDIKPQNIMVGHYGEVFLMDWGVAKVLGEPERETDPVTQEFLTDIMITLKGKKGQIGGSPAFMSPEQAHGKFSLVDQQTDIFLLGATLYCMFTLAPPYFGKDIFDVLHKAKHRELIPPEKRTPGRQIPKEICRMIMKAMAHAKEDRYATVEDFIKDIDDVLAGKWSQQEKKTFAAGEMLMAEGETGEEAYLLIRGSVLITKKLKDGRVVILRTCQEGDIVGEMSLISDELRSATVQALEPTEVAVLTKRVIAQNLKKLPPYMEKIVSSLVHRLQETTERTR